MAERRLSAEEAALWRRVMASVRPLGPVPPLPVADAPEPVKRKPAAAAGKPPVQVPVPKPKPSAPGTTLDASWDRKLARGLVSPDRTVDLHGHGLNSAYLLLDQSLDRAIAAGERLILLVTGKPPRPDSERPHARGAIRAAVGDWLAASRHADRIAAVRGAHPRHGGAGALYIVLRKSRQVS
ncbi:Smr/MutS family protein [Sphingomonas cannabina]|nr:Smr/MutS family protein [Sphingomonas cannabina]UIJ44394.1 Smr/MutS family protein [Sphingomonas cannabina]